VTTRRPNHACRCGGECEADDADRHVHPVRRFAKGIVRQMASTVDRPIIMPLSNPTSKAEAVPEDLIRWTDGRALVATGSPFPPVNHDGRTYTIAQANNALIFPGLGLGVAVVCARRINDAMIAAAADTIAALAHPTGTGAALLPRVTDLRTVSAEQPLTDPVRQNSPSNVAPRVSTVRTDLSREVSTQQTAIFGCWQLPDRSVDPNAESCLRVRDSSDKSRQAC
jgi:malic enzyme